MAYSVLPPPVSITPTLPPCSAPKAVIAPRYEADASSSPREHVQRHAEDLAHALGELRRRCRRGAPRSSRRRRASRNARARRARASCTRVERARHRLARRVRRARRKPFADARADRAREIDVRNVGRHVGQKHARGVRTDRDDGVMLAHSVIAISLFAVCGFEEWPRGASSARSAVRARGRRRRRSPILACSLRYSAICSSSSSSRSAGASVTIGRRQPGCALRNRAACGRRASARSRRDAPRRRPRERSRVRPLRGAPSRRRR